MKYFIFHVPNFPYGNREKHGYTTHCVRASSYQEARRILALDYGQGKCPAGTIHYRTMHALDPSINDEWTQMHPAMATPLQFMRIVA